jgi:nucleotide-binding universal stress UspA family protein
LALILKVRDGLRAHFTNVATESRVTEGSVAESIADVATELGAAYLVVGTRGRSSLARLILGDTTQSILHHAPCPVVVVPLRSAS